MPKRSICPENTIDSNVIIFIGFEITKENRVKSSHAIMYYFCCKSCFLFLFSLLST
ncbi:TRASH domain-containing protein [Aquimarina algiphila]|uniref:TRASH domain-containing protein n=1 Tax=Aquimarina algiphila TaxID=2047982 RepID=A0A554VS96_9FLAO|nr:TRASH domain-containing protein [Aquimarina algiphila]